MITRALGRDSFQEVIRSAVFDALAFMKERRGIDLAIEWSAYGRPQNARIGAMGALCVLAKEHKGERERVIKHLTEVLKDGSARVRIAATRALGRTGDVAVLKILREVERTEAISQITHGISPRHRKHRRVGAQSAKSLIWYHPIAKFNQAQSINKEDE